MNLIIAAQTPTQSHIQGALPAWASDWRVCVVDSTAALLHLCLRGQGGLVLLDLSLGPMQADETVGLLREVDPSLLIVPLAGPDHHDMEFILRKMGVFYYMLHPIDADELSAVLESAQRTMQLAFTSGHHEARK